MRLRLIAASVMLAVFVLGAATVGARPEFASYRHRDCSKLFTVRMGERAALAIYSSTRAVSMKNLRLLGYIERCQRNPMAQGFVRWYDHHQAALQRERIYQAHLALIFPYDGWAIPTTIIECESHFQNLTPNSAGASGYYQIIPSTWSGYGGTRYAREAYEATRYEQSIIAARIWNHGSGSSQWVCKA